MIEGRSGSRSLRRRLVGNLLIAAISMALLLGILGAAIIYQIVNAVSDRLLDGSLQAIADRLTVENGEVTLDFPPAALGMLENEDRDNVYYGVWQGSRLVTGYADLPRPATLLVAEAINHRDARYHGMNIRVAALQRRLYSEAEPVVIEVAETTVTRDRLGRSMWIGLGLLEAALIGLSSLVVWLAVGRGLAPLAMLRRDLAERLAPGSFSMKPLPLAAVPTELLPLVGSFNDLLARLDRSFSAIRRFTGDASHQMRTPLAILLTHLDLVRRLGTARKEGRAALADAAEGARRLERLTAQLLALARADEQQATAVAETSDLITVAAAVARERAPQAIAAGMELSFEAVEDAGVVRVQGAALMIAEVIGNLLDNAIRYNRPGGAIVLRVKRGERPSIEIEDEGPGISEADRELVFERFYRVKRNVAGGTGLGLSIVRAIADRLGAEVALINREGNGLIATVKFMPGA